MTGLLGVKAGAPGCDSNKVASIALFGSLLAFPYFIDVAMTRIEICGGIASGKSTLANALVPEPVREDFRDNPFWAAFYSAPNLWVEEKNFCFLVQHTGAIKKALNSPLIVCDFAVIQDLAYASLVPRPHHFDMMRALYAHLYGQLPPPSLIVHLKCSSDIQKQRIAKRNRQEEAGLTIDALDALNEAIEAMLEDVRRNTPVYTVGSEAVNFTANATCAAEFRDELLARVEL